jgi:hypothetical protein
MTRAPLTLLLVAAALTLFHANAHAGEPKLYTDALKLDAPHVSADNAVKYDYDIVYVRAPRHGDEKLSVWAEVLDPTRMEPGSDLMLLHPDGSEEVLVAAGKGAVLDPAVSLDGQWVYYAHLHDLSGGKVSLSPHGSDLYKINVKTREVVRLTEQKFTPNLGAADWAADFRNPEGGKDYIHYGVFNLAPCPLPGGRLAFVSNRNGFRPPRAPMPVPTLQLFVMDEDGRNVDLIGHMNLGNALHPVALKDGRIMFSSFESQGLRSADSWGIWSIHPDGSNWGPIVSAFEVSGIGANNSFHFQTQLTDGSLVIESYYINNNNGMGAYLKMPPQAPQGQPGFGPGHANDPRNPPLRFGRHYNGHPMELRLPFSPYGVESLTPFANNGEGTAGPAILNDPNSPHVGKFTHPSGAPDNHLLTVWASGPVNHQNGAHKPLPDAGIYLIKDGKAIEQPADMLLVKNDPKFNEQWPRAVASYKRIYGIEEPGRPDPVLNDGKLSKHLPEGTPFGLIGSSSLYKRETYPDGVVPEGKTAATFAGGPDRTDGWLGLEPFNTSENGVSYDWTHQGAEAAIYENSEIHAVRVLAMEPTSDRHGRRGFYNHANERLRILGEIPVRKFGPDGKQPVDPDGNPDTSFLAKVPADVPWTFQTIDKDGMVLNAAQTWHQVRPGEVRNNCGGCHAHSQQPTAFEKTAAAADGYQVFDLTRTTPLITGKPNDQSNHQWDAAGETGLKQVDAAVVNVEYTRDVKPILQRSCVACHTKSSKEPAGNLVLDGDEERYDVTYVGSFPGTYYRLALDREAKFGHKPINDRYVGRVWRQENASRYVRMFQSRRSLLAWKILGRRADGFSNDDFPTETTSGDVTTLAHRGQRVEPTAENLNRADLDYTGSVMPPPEAVAGTYQGPDGGMVKVEPLSDEDRRTILRWIDLGCPIELDPTYGWAGDDLRPILTLTYPRRGNNDGELTRLLVGAYDYGSGLDASSLSVTADFEVDGAPAGTNLAPRFQPRTDGVYELKLAKPISNLPRGVVTVLVKDRASNETRVERTFSVGTSK